MKVLTWNLGYWQHQAYNAEAWAYLLNVIRPDIALLQEVCCPCLGPDASIVFKEVTRRWVAAVYVKGSALEEITVKEQPNRVAAGILRTGTGDRAGTGYNPVGTIEEDPERDPFIEGNSQLTLPP